MKNKEKMQSHLSRISEAVKSTRKVYIIFFFILLLNNLCAQKLMPLRKTFAGTSITYENAQILYKYYFFVGSDSIRFHEQTYLSLTVSDDSSEVCGYIRFDSITKEVLFLSKYNNDSDAITECKNVGNVQVLFSFHQGVSKELCFVGNLGQHFYLFTRDYGNGRFSMEILSEDNYPSHTERIDKLLFDKEWYPKEIVMINQVGDKFFLK